MSEQSRDDATAEGRRHRAEAAARFCGELARENGYPLVVPHPDGRRWVGIMPFAYTVAIGTGPLGDRYFVEDRWCFHSSGAALAAMVKWLAGGGEGEPEGWHRHPMSGRRREDGDPAREVVRA